MILPIGNSLPANKAGRAARAFTLVEMVLVMTLLVVMLSYVAPSLAHFFRGRNLNSEARRLLALTRYGQSRAVSEGIPMMLWVDPKLGAYGLKAQTGYMDQDPRAVQYTVAPELQIEVQMPRTVQTNFWTMAPLQTKLTQPTICFLPDGFISQSSPYEILLRAPRDNDAVWLAESANRLSYEIRTNQLIYGRY
jgi:prepilin-type N-terminal cleavage/methylation domain-containing protein